MKASDTVSLVLWWLWRNVFLGWKPWWLDFNISRNSRRVQGLVGRRLPYCAVPNSVHFSLLLSYSAARAGFAPRGKVPRPAPFVTHISEAGLFQAALSNPSHLRAAALLRVPLFAITAARIFSGGQVSIPDLHTRRLDLDGLNQSCLADAPTGRILRGCW
jgi:hypothetical protein